MAGTTVAGITFKYYDSLREDRFMDRFESNYIVSHEHLQCSCQTEEQSNNEMTIHLTLVNICQNLIKLIKNK